MLENFKNIMAKLKILGYSRNIFRKAYKKLVFRKLKSFFLCPNSGPAYLL
jgi:hypothetical protein